MTEYPNTIEKGEKRYTRTCASDERRGPILDTPAFLGMITRRGVFLNMPYFLSNSRSSLLFLFLTSMLCSYRSLPPLLSFLVTSILSSHPNF